MTNSNERPDETRTGAADGTAAQQCLVTDDGIKQKLEDTNYNGKKITRRNWPRGLRHRAAVVRLWDRGFETPQGTYIHLLCVFCLV
jgi:hypothetical protein